MREFIIKRTGRAGIGDVAANMESVLVDESLFAAVDEDVDHGGCGIDCNVGTVVA